MKPSETASIVICDDNMFNLETLQEIVSLKFNLDAVISSSGQDLITMVEKRIEKNKKNG